MNRRARWTIEDRESKARLRARDEERRRLGIEPLVLHIDLSRDQWAALMGKADGADLNAIARRLLLAWARTPAAVGVAARHLDAARLLVESAAGNRMHLEDHIARGLAVAEDIGAAAGRADAQEDLDAWTEVGRLICEADPMRPSPSPAVCMAGVRGIRDANRTLRDRVADLRAQLASPAAPESGAPVLTAPSPLPAPIPTFDAMRRVVVTRSGYDPDHPELTPLDPTLEGHPPVLPNAPCTLEPRDGWPLDGSGAGGGDR